MPSEDEQLLRTSTRQSPLPSSNSYYAEEFIENENKKLENGDSFSRMTKRVSKQWVQQDNSDTREHSYTPLFQRPIRYQSHSKSPSPNFNTLHRKTKQFENTYALPPKIKLNLSMAPHLRLRESEIRSSVSPVPKITTQLRRANSTASNTDVTKRGNSPFTYIETTSIKKKTPKRQKQEYYILNNENSSARSSPARTRESHKNLLLTQVSPNYQVS